MSAARRNSEQFLPMIAVEAHFAADTIAFLDHRQNIGVVLPKRAGTPVNTAAILIVADELWPERPAEGEARVKDFRDQAFVSVIPHVFIECTNDFLLR